jgi:hypothetical protein
MNMEAKKIRLIMELRSQGVTDTKVLGAIERIPREVFVPSAFQDRSYENVALPIGHGQTISQPAVVGYMTQELELGERMKVLEIGTGSGYQAAILSRLCRRLYTVERSRLAGASAVRAHHRHRRRARCPARPARTTRAGRRDDPARRRDIGNAATAQVPSNERRDRLSEPVAGPFRSPADGRGKRRRLILQRVAPRAYERTGFDQRSEPWRDVAKFMLLR